MAAEAEPQIVPIEVSSRIIRHIGRGIYRTPAAALKELVSNSYDARASEVTIDTGYPIFKAMVVRDNGDGMTRQDFIRFVGQIGLTTKVAGDRIVMPSGQKYRSFIGHFGIGLLAIGQLAKKAVITSKTRDTETGFVAEIDFDQFEVSKEAGLERARVKDESLLESWEKDRIEQQGPDTKLPVGTCTIRDVVFKTESRSDHFTEIELRTIRLDVKQKLSGEIRDKLNPNAVKTQRYSASFEDLIALLREHEGEYRQGHYPYEMLCWELGVYCPVKYKEIGPFREGEPLRKVYDLASQYSFSVKVDGFTITKPLDQAFFEDKDYPIERIFVWNDEEYACDSKSLRVTGYLIYKRQIRPKITQGVLVREGGVAIGSYDTTYLQYPYYEGFKFAQLTGELFSEGLSGALNIDRNSFNETDDIYLALAAWLHAKLQKEVFPVIKEMGREVSAKPRAANIELADSVLSRLAQQVESACKEISFENLGRKGPLLKLEEHKLLINKEHPDGSGSGAKTDKLLFVASLVLEGKITPADVEELQSLITRLRSEVRQR